MTPTHISGRSKGKEGEGTCMYNSYFNKIKIFKKVAQTSADQSVSSVCYLEISVFGVRL